MQPASRNDSEVILGGQDTSGDGRRPASLNARASPSQRRRPGLRGKCARRPRGFHGRARRAECRPDARHVASARAAAPFRVLALLVADKAASRVLAAMPTRRRTQVSTRTVAGLANRHKQATVPDGATPLLPGARWALPVHAPHELEGDTGAQVRGARSALSIRSSSITTGRPTSRARAGPPLSLTGPLTVPSAVTTCHGYR